jgi:hypothetical protein
MHRQMFYRGNRRATGRCQGPSYKRLILSKDGVRFPHPTPSFKAEAF